MKKYLTVFLLAALAQPSFATDSNEMAHQCEQYGAYQNNEDEWVTCEYEEEPVTEEVDEYSDSTEYEDNDSSEYQEEDNQ